MATVPFLIGGGSFPGLILAADPPKSVATIDVSPTAYSLNPCESKQFSATAKGANGEDVPDAKVTWHSTNPEVAKVDGQGVVTGVSPGYTFIRAIVGSIKGNPAPVFVRDKGVSRKC